MHYGISEAEYWDMTIGEAERAIESRINKEKLQNQERAVMDYKLAELVGKHFSRAMNGSKVSIPEILDHYEFLFQDEIQKKAIEERKREQRMAKSMAAFIGFADSHNKQFITDAATKEVANE